MANFSFKDLMRKAKSAPGSNQRWALISLLGVFALLVWWIANFFA